MTENNHIIFVVAGINTNKSNSKNSYKCMTSSHENENLYLNYGALGLATRLDECGYNVILIQADNRTPEELFCYLNSSSIYMNTNKFPMFISIPSFYAIEWTKQFSNIIKNYNSLMKICAGGRWVIDNNEKWIANKLPDIDFFINGCPDDNIEDYLYTANWNKAFFNTYKTTFKRFNYKLLDDYKKYQPVIEIQRGCFGKCSFCLEKNYRMCNCKEPHAVIAEIIDILAQYGLEESEKDIYFYFEGAVFTPTKDWSKKFAKIYTNKHLAFGWRFESRVDSLDKEVLPILAKAGLKVLDLGIESASPKQLIAMDKTNNPAIYLNRAEELIKAAYECGVWVKLNTLIYPGESVETISETISWYDKIKPYIKGISCNPLYIYLNGEYTEEYIGMIEKLSSRKVDRISLYEQGYVEAAISEDYPTSAEVQKLVNDFYLRYMDEEAAIALKEITYTARRKYE